MGKPQDKKSESRVIYFPYFIHCILNNGFSFWKSKIIILTLQVIVYERKSGRLLAGPNAPTAENLKAWLQKNPTFEVVRPGTLSTIKPNISKKKVSNEPHKIQTTLNFERVPRKSVETPTSSKTHLDIRTRTPQQEAKLRTPQPEMKLKVMTPEAKARPQQERFTKTIMSPKEEVRMLSQPKTPISSRAQAPQYPETPKASTSAAKPTSEPRRLVRTASRSQVVHEKVCNFGLVFSISVNGTDVNIKLQYTLYKASNALYIIMPFYSD